jgi:hypothetical protein
MQKLRDWLPFGRPNGGEDNSILEAWRFPLAGLDPGAVAEELRRQLIDHHAATSNPHARLKLLEACYHESLGALPKIEAAVSHAGLPLPGEILQDALAADNLLKAMAAGYIGLIDTLRAQKLPASALNLVRLSTLRAIQCLARRQQLACRAYAPASANTWQQLHATFAYARQQGLTRYANGGRPLEQEYLGAVLLAYADPTKFSRHDLVPLIECAAHFAPLALIHNAATVAADSIRSPQFLVHETDQHCGKRLVTTTPDERNDGWVVDCAHLVSAINALLAHRQKGLAPTPNDPGTADAMLQAVAKMWRGQRVRRFSRQSFKPRGELVTGLAPLIQALDTDDVAAGSEWAIFDESPDGFGLRYLRGEAVDLQVGELVGLRPREHERLHVCLIRRVVNAGAARLELGLQEIAPLAFALSIPNGHAGGNPGLFFPAMPAHRGIPGALARAGDLTPGLDLSVAGQPPMRALRAIETDGRYELWELSPR